MSHNSTDYFMPAEWTRHRGTLMEWPVADPVWGDDLDNAKRAFADVARTIARFEPVTLIVNPGESAEAAAYLSISDGITVIELAHDDCWARDNGPTFVKHKTTGALAGINWRFNAWGGRFPYALDDTIPERYLAPLNLPRIDAPIILEGGSIHTNGAGILLTTEECLLNPNRNPSLSKAQLEDILLAHLGAERVVWLPYGLDGDETDGHVDNVCCFIDDDTVLLPWTDDNAHPNFERLAADRAVLERAGLRIELLPQPPVVLHRDAPLTLSYINFLFVNGGIVMPSFGGDAAETDVLALETMRRLFPDRAVVAPSTLDILKGGGNIHCITQQIPL